MKTIVPPEVKATRQALAKLLTKADRVCLHFERVQESQEYGPNQNLTYANASVKVRCLRTVHNKDVEETMYMRAVIINGHNDERETLPDSYSGTYMRYTGIFAPVAGFWGIIYNVDNVRAALKGLPSSSGTNF